MSTRATRAKPLTEPHLKRGGQGRSISMDCRQENCGSCIWENCDCCHGEQEYVRGRWRAPSHYPRNY